MEQSFTERCNHIFNQVIRDYHLTDDVDSKIQNPYERGTIEYSLYLKYKVLCLPILYQCLFLYLIN